MSVTRIDPAAAKDYPCPVQHAYQVGEPLKWTDIPGWLTPEEGRVLQSLAMGKRVLELGSYKGRSTVCMAMVASGVVSVDHHRGDRNTGRADTECDFLDNVTKAGAEHVVDPWACTVADFDSCVVDHRKGFDLAFVDVEHTEESTSEALNVAKRRVRPGGIIAWHDADRAEVRAAVAAVGLAPMASAGTLEWCKV